jgi:hypothetical protein
MIEIVREYIAREEARASFELAYGPGGAWGTVFSDAPGFRGITLMRDAKNPRRYLTVDLWDTETQRDLALAGRKAACSSLESSMTDWTESMVEVGIFRVLAEGTVRPRRGVSRGRRRTAR